MKEEEIRPTSIFDTYLSLCQQDVAHFFSNGERDHIPCPACGADGEFAFEKHDFSYELCPECKTLYVSPRPRSETFDRYYRESESAKFWATTFYKETAEARREKVWMPKAEKNYKKMQDFNAQNHRVVDIGGGYGIFAQEMEKIIHHPVTIIEPGPSLAHVCRSNGLNVVEKFFNHVVPEDLPDTPIMFVSFELFEHLYDPELFLTQVGDAMDERDLFVFTTLSGQGIDILTLWDESKSICPPHHLNFFNPGSIELLLKRMGFQPVEVTTPGKLDIDILSSYASGENRFWERFNAVADDRTREKWQAVVSETGWSSHMMVTCRKHVSG